MLGRIYQTAQHYVSLNHQSYLFIYLFYCAVTEFAYSVILDPRIYEIIRSANFQLAKIPFQRARGAILNHLLLGEK